MWSFEYPFSLLLFLTVPFFIYFVHFRKRKGGSILFNFALWNIRPELLKINPARICHVFFWILFWLGFSSYIIASGGPHIIGKEQVYLTRGVDLVVVLDESGSMSTPDFEPGNRFESAKAVIKKFIRARENDQIGLVTFSTDAVLRVPPTLDYAVLENTLKELKSMQLGEETAIGMGIAVAVLHLRSSKAQNKVVVLITDGVNNQGQVSPEEAAALASDIGVRIYTIGIGRKSDTKWTYKDPVTGRNITGLSGEFDEQLLIKIAGITGGKYFYAGDPGALDAIFGEIDSMVKTEKRLRVHVKRIPKHGLFILIGVILLTVSYAGRKILLKEIF